MDVDNGMFPFSLFPSRTYKFLSETPVTTQDSTKKVRLLPYVLVPGMATDSRLFRKAQVTISKQATATSPPASKDVSVERLFTLQHGNSFFLFGYQ